MFGIRQVLTAIVLAVSLGIPGQAASAVAPDTAPDQSSMAFTGLSAPQGVAVDAAGDVFAADTGNDQVVEVAAGSSGQVVLPFSGLSAPQGVAVDAAGDVFAADTGNNQVVELSGYVPTVTAITSVSPATVATGQPFTVSVSVTSQAGTVAPDGQVAVSDGGNGSCSMTLTAGTGPAADTGSGSCQLTEDTAGSYPLTAAYSGQGEFAASSNVSGVTVDTVPAFESSTPPLAATVGHAYEYSFSASGVPAPDFALASGAPSWLSIDPTTGVLTGTVPAGTSSFSYTVTATNPMGATAAGPFTVQVPVPGPYLTLLFSRTEMTASDNCVPDDSGVAPLATMVAPYLQSLGMSGTGTLETGKTPATAPLCVHYNDSLAASWADAASLADNFGWSFGSATATYPSNLTKLTPSQAYAQICGSAAAIDAHGLPGGHGIIDYPGAQPLPSTLQAEYGASCYAWGRQYLNTGTTPISAGSTPPYWQYTDAVNGGYCNTPKSACAKVAPGTPASKVPRYTLPTTIISRIDALQPGQWFTLQAFVLVTGTSPAYSSNGTRWDCTSSNPKLHWTNDNERYCYSDWQQIVQAIAARHAITVTNPLTVGIAFGRPATYP